MSFQSPAAASRFLPAVTDTVYRLILGECISTIAKFAKHDRSGCCCLHMKNSAGGNVLKEQERDDFSEAKFNTDSDAGIVCNPRHRHVSVSMKK